MKRFFIILFFFSSCKSDSENECVIAIDKFIDEYGQKVVSIDSTGLNSTELMDLNPYNNKAGIYSFNSNGLLTQYRFFANTNVYTYMEEYKPSGEIKRKLGTPLVNYELRYITRDSISFLVSYYSFNRAYDILTVSAGEKKKYFFHLIPDTSFVNIHITSFGIALDSGTHTIYLDTRYKHFCDSKWENIRDTISVL